MPFSPDALTALHAHGFTPREITHLERMEARARDEQRATGRPTNRALYATVGATTLPAPTRDVLREALVIWGLGAPAATSLSAEFRRAGVVDPGRIGAMLRDAAGGARRLSAAAVARVKLNLYAAARRAAA